MSIYKKLMLAKGNFEKVLKSADNPFFKSKFADLNSIMEAVVPALTEQGLLLLQPVEGDKVVTMVVDIESGEKVVSFLTIPTTLTDPQKIGGAVTYFRRYGLQSLLGLMAEDDDGNSISEAANKAKPAVKVPVTEVIPITPSSGGFKRPLGAPKTNGTAGPVVPAVVSKQEVNKLKTWDDA